MNFDEGHDGKPCCSFCGKREGQVKRLISGRGVFICDECVDFCKSMLDEEKKAMLPSSWRMQLICRSLRKSRQS